MRTLKRCVAMLLILMVLPSVLLSQSLRSEGAYHDWLNHLAGTRGIDAHQPLFRISGEIDATQASFMSIWDGPDDIRSLPATALVMTAQSTDSDDEAGGIGLDSLAIDCLDINFDIIDRQVIAMDGTNVVNIPVACFRIQRIVGLDPNETGQTNLGDITIENAGTVYEFIPAGIGGSKSFAFTVPNEHVLILNKAAIFPGPDEIMLRIIADSLGVVPDLTTLSIDGSPHEFDLSECHSEGTDLTAVVRSGQGAIPVSVEIHVDAVPVTKVGGQCP